MDYPSPPVSTPKQIERRNWWKIGFWIALLAFEVARELVVIQSKPHPVIRGALFVEQIRPGRVIASGRWERIDRGEPIMPVLTSIDCRQELGSCVVADTILYRDGGVHPPNIETYEAKFLNDRITIINESAICSKYTVNLDIKLKKAFSIKEDKENSPEDVCKIFKERMEMQLVEPFIPNDFEQFDGSFLPIFGIVKSISEI